jgi:hypothetical protein
MLVAMEATNRALTSFIISWNNFADLFNVYLFKQSVALLDSTKFSVRTQE